MENKTKLKKRGRRENYTKLSTNEKREREEMIHKRVYLYMLKP